MKKKDYVFWFFAVLFIILIFAGIDYLIHGLSDEYGVPSRYFGNKIIYGTLIGYGAYLLLKGKELFKKSLLFSLCVSILLQAKYYIEGYPKDFVFLFLGIHFIILLVVSYPVFRYFERKSKKDKTKESR